MYYDGFRVAVLFNDPEWAEEWLDLFKERIDGAAISCIRRYGKGNFKIDMRDGTTLQSIKHGSEEIGKRYDKIYVEPCINVDGDFFKKSVMPMVFSPIIISDRENYSDVHIVKSSMEIEHNETVLGYSGLPQA